MNYAPSLGVTSLASLVDCRRITVFASTCRDGGRLPLLGLSSCGVGSGGSRISWGRREQRRRPVARPSKNQKRISCEVFGQDPCATNQMGGKSWTIHGVHPRTNDFANIRVHDRPKDASGIVWRCIKHVAPINKVGHSWFKETIKEQKERVKNTRTKLVNSSKTRGNQRMHSSHAIFHISPKHNKKGARHACTFPGSRTHMGFTGRFGAANRGIGGFGSFASSTPP